MPDKKVYLAGKIFTPGNADYCDQDWRWAILDHPRQPKWLEGARFKGDERWPSFPTTVPGVVCNGPYCADQHGCDDGYKLHQQTHILRLCMLAIRECDFVFADLSDPTCHGTLWELGYATAFRKPVCAWRAHPDLWFAERAAWLNAGHTPDLKTAFEYVCSILAPQPTEPPCPGDSPIEQAFAKAYRQLTGSYPRAQVQIGAYRVDFVCGDKLVVECDGHAWHSSKEQRGADAKRDRELQRMGYRVIRFTGTQIHADAAGCAREASALA